MSAWKEKSLPYDVFFLPVVCHQSTSNDTWRNSLRLQRYNPVGAMVLARGRN